MAEGDLIIGTSSSLKKLATIPGIDGTAVASTPMFTVPTGKSAIIIGAMVKNVAVAGLSVDPIVQVEDTPAAANIITSTTLLGIGALGKGAFLSPIGGITLVVPAGAVISFNITTGATATTLTLDVDLLGYLV